MENNSLPDFMKYKDGYASEKFIDKISRIAKRAGSKFVYVSLILYYTLQGDNVSLKDKAIIIGALGYLISPLDIIPDAIPIAGLGDDLAVLMYVLKNVWDDVPVDVREKAHSRLSKWFDDDEMKEADNVFSDGNA